MGDKIVPLYLSERGAEQMARILKRNNESLETRRRIASAVAYALLRTETTVYASYLDRAEDMVDDIMRIL